ncbi:alpha/beta hydrolase [Planctomonas sp. JC2975]|uniref:alpha/beta fold hydrolase n=1 Tax=Planctomonas sp. JC2975 TaxID=2729626 RepID=UPI00147305AA|nr:alpha/beta hydrolase [Planctomonas sp. JC2975]NNC11369.1 alpha/beta hydrolase [Planctomonas sp. JC2975]
MKPESFSLHRHLTVAFVAATAVAVAVGLSACATPAPTSSHAASTSAAYLRMIENDGHRIAFHVTPGSLPAVVLDAGGGADSSYWNILVPLLSAATGSEIVTYDREGMGGSDVVSGAYSMKREASDLHAGMKQLGIAGHSVLVSHSEAGEIATSLVNEHPRDVEGAVLVDASLPEFYTKTEIARVVAANTPEVAQLKKLTKLTPAERQLVATAKDYAPEHAAYHELSWPASVPATVIPSASTPFPTAEDANLWRQAQVDFASAAANRRLVKAPGTSHDVPLDAPQLVVREITDMLTSVG